MWLIKVFFSKWSAIAEGFLVGLLLLLATKKNQEKKN